MPVWEGNLSNTEVIPSLLARFDSLIALLVIYCPDVILSLMIARIAA
jgi:hypothetical protein